MAEDKIPVQVPGLKEPVLFPRTMTAEQIRAAIEQDILPTLQAPAAPAAAPASQGGMLSDAMALLRQGAGVVDPMGEMVTSGMAGERPQLEGAAAAARFAAVPALTNPFAQGAVAAGGELMAQGFEQTMGTREGFDPTAAAVSGAIPPVMAGAGAVLRAGARKLPGAGATLHQMAKDSLERLATIFGPTQSSDELYAIVRQSNPGVAMPRLKTAAKGLLDEETLAEAGLELTGVAKTASALDRRLQPVTLPWAGQQPGEMAFDKAFLNLKRIGGKIRETRIAGGEEHGAWKTLWREGMKDLEAAAAAGAEAAPAVRALKQANAAARREYVQEEIADIFTKGGLTSRPDIGPDAFAVNFGRIADALRKGKHAEDIKAVLSKDEYAGLLARVSELAKQTPNLPPPRGQFAGSAIRIGQIGAATGTGVLAGQAFGVDPLTAGAIGTVVGSKGVDYLTRLLMNDHGRKVLAHFLSQSGGIITQKALSLLGLAAAQLPEVRGTVGDGTVRLGNLGQQQFMGSQP